MVYCFICNSDQRVSHSIIGNNRDEVMVQKRCDLALLHRDRFRQPPANIEQHSKLCLACDNRLVSVIEIEDNGNAIPMEVLVGKRGKCFACE